MTSNASDTRMIRYPCRKCSALLTYNPGTDHLLCNYCGAENQIERRLDAIEELDLHMALTELNKGQPTATITQILCEGCGASFKFAESVHAGKCPFCGTVIVTSNSQARPISPKSLLPFQVNEKEANIHFYNWLKGLWFAPNALKKYGTDNHIRLQGVYLPYWTFDCQTETIYLGARGDVYYVNQPVQIARGGQLVTEIRQTPKINWTPVRGRVERFFDDVLIGASKSLPRQILDQLQPWDLENLVRYDDRYITGFNSEYYQLNLDQGFDEAKQKMDNVIYQDIAFDIGGDQQRIDQLNTKHYNSTFKHCLLPIWSAGFYYRQRIYHLIINGRTGQVYGERPYSYWKIAFAILFGLVIVGGLYLFLERDGRLPHTPSDFRYDMTVPSSYYDEKTITP